MTTSSSTHATVTIPTWANGPDGSGNGGWSAALLAVHVDEAHAAEGVAVSLRVPPPLGRELQVVPGEAPGELQLIDGTGEQDVLVATATPASVELTVPEAVRGISLDAARAARDGFPFRDEHPFPRCVSCGTRRDPALGPALHLHCGPVDGVTVPDEQGAPTPVFADTWTPAADVADHADPALASVAACWSALDCPSATPFADPTDEHPTVLARFAVRLARQARVGEPHVLAAWQCAVDGRKKRSVSVLLDQHGELLGRAEALWIEVRPR